MQTFKECPDLTSDPLRRQHMDEFAMEYNTRLYGIAADWQAQRLQNFTVIVQPFTQNMIIEGVEDVSSMYHMYCL